MLFQAVEPFAVVFVSLTSLVSMFITDLRIGIGLLALQYFGVFLIVGSNLPVILALTLLFAGWMAGAVLGMAAVSFSSDQNRLGQGPASSQTINPLFNLLASTIIFLVVLSSIPRMSQWMPTLNAWQSWAALALLGLGILRLALNAQPASLALSLLSVFSGFEILFVGLTSSLTAFGLLAAVTLFIALGCSYLLVAPSMEDTQ